MNVWRALMSVDDIPAPKLRLTTLDGARHELLRTLSDHGIRLIVREMMADFGVTADPRAGAAMNDPSVYDPSWRRFIAVMRTALETYDAEDEFAPDRHASTCSCQLCDLVRNIRGMVDTFDHASLLTVLAARSAL